MCLGSTINIEALSSHNIAAALLPEVRAQLPQLLIFDELNSTNDYLLEYAQTHTENAVCLAERQTAGRGRFERRWISPPGANLYFSLLWHFPKTLSFLGLNLVVGCAIVEAISSVLSMEGLQLKWPNDVLWQAKKLAGVLIEIVNGKTTVIGIGINIHMPAAAAEDIQKPWSDLRMATGQVISRSVLTSALLNHLVTHLQRFATEGAGYLVDDWYRYDILRGLSVRVQLPDEVVCGIAQGVNAQGQLILRDERGIDRAIFSGEASLI